MIEDEQTIGRFEVRTTSDSHFGWIRTGLALERTLLAWLRTAAGMIGFGIAIIQFFQHLERVERMAGSLPTERPHDARDLGLALIGGGILTLLIATVRYRSYLNYLWSSPFRALAATESRLTGRIPWITPAVGIAILVIVIGTLAFAAVLFGRI